MRSWSIKKQLSVGFAFLLGCMSCMAGLSAKRMLSVLSVQGQYAAGLLPAAKLTNDFQREMLNARISLIYYITLQKPESRELGLEHLHSAEGTLAKLNALLERRQELTELQPLVTNLNQEFGEYQAELGRTIALVEGGTTTGEVFNTQVKRWAARGAALVEDADKAQTLSAEMADTHNQANIESLHFTVTLCITLFALSLVVCVCLAVTVVRKLNLALSEVAAALEKSSGQIALSSSEIATFSQALAQNASEQAATLQETAAASTQINAMARKTKENSMATAHCVGGAQAGCKQTNTSLVEMEKAMEAIYASSQRVSKIIKVIDEIAFQTNILALNASVEAARAGEHGQGFAVVADEVRNLAQRSASAARDTTELMQQSMEHSNYGRDRMQAVLEDMRTVTQENARIYKLVDEIKVGSVEQARGVEQIDRAINQMEQVTQSSAAQAEQGAASAAELNTQAVAMSDIVRWLKIMVEGTTRSYS